MKPTSNSKKRRGPVASVGSPAASANQFAQAASANPHLWKIIGLGLVLIVLLAAGLLAQRWSVEASILELRRSSDQALREADWPAVERLGREWAVMEPHAVRPWTLAASAARAMGNLEQCAAYLSQLPDTAPIEAFHELSLLQMETLIEPLAARQTCLRTLRLHPDDNESSRRLLFIHAMLCHRQAVTAEARRAIQAGADSRTTYAYLFTANWLTFANGAELNRYWLEQDPDNEDFQVAALSHAILHRDINSASAASNSTASHAGVAPRDNQAQLHALLNRYPANLELQMIALENFLQAGQVVELGELLNKQPAEAQEESRYWRFRGWYLAAEEQWPQATAAYQRSLEISPLNFNSQNELAGVWRRTQGIAAASELQTTAKLGIDCSLAVLQAPNFEALSHSDYARMAEYFELCGETEAADGLRKHLR